MGYKECTVKNGLDKKCKRRAVRIISNNSNNKKDYMCTKCYEAYNNSFFTGTIGFVKLIIKDI